MARLPQRSAAQATDGSRERERERERGREGERERESGERWGERERDREREREREKDINKKKRKKNDTVYRACVSHKLPRDERLLIPFTETSYSLSTINHTSNNICNAAYIIAGIKHYT